jgi:hypothetical protein
VLAALVVAWAARLGTFLFRIRRTGGDGRFDAIIPVPLGVRVTLRPGVVMTAGAAGGHRRWHGAADPALIVGGDLGHPVRDRGGRHPEVA